MGNYNLNLSFSPEFIDSRVKCNGHFTIISFTPFCKFLCIMKTDGFHCLQYLLPPFGCHADSVL